MRFSPLAYAPLEPRQVELLPALEHWRHWIYPVSGYPLQSLETFVNKDIRG